MADLQQILGTMPATGMGGRSGRTADHIGSVPDRPGITRLNDPERIRQIQAA